MFCWQETRYQLGQHRINRQGSSARDFVPVQSFKNEGILYVFPIFGTVEPVQKIRWDPQTHLCGVAFEDIIINSSLGIITIMLLPFALICVLCLSLDDFNHKNAAAIPQKNLGIFVQLLISNQLFFCKGTEIFLSQSADEAGAAEDVRQFAGFGVSDCTVWFQS